MQKVTLKPIGLVKSQWDQPGQPPKQGPKLGAESYIEIIPEWEAGLEGLAPGRQIWVLALFHQAQEPGLKVHPRGDATRPLTGVFNTRSPKRPCPISLTLVELLGIEGSRLTVQGLELIDGTPVLDIKPYIPDLDRPQTYS